MDKVSREVERQAAELALQVERGAAIELAKANKKGAEAGLESMLMVVLCILCPPVGLGYALWHFYSGTKK